MATTILYGTREETVENAAPEGDRLWIPLTDLVRASGWERKPQGLCQGETCVPVPQARRAEWIDEARGRFDLAGFARHLGQAVVRDDAHGVAAFGEAAAVAPEDVTAPDFTLPDLDGKMHSPSELRGKKVFLFSWASW
ncbi:MAG: hypothetical protein ACREQ9_27015 [Candidatus Binatia bacterium]